MDNEKLLLFAADVLDEKPPPFIGKLTFNCGHSFFARMGIKVSGLKTDNGKTVLICDIPVLDYDQYTRSYARINTNISVELTLLKPDNDNNSNLNPISKPVHGILKNLSPAGARIAIAKNDVSLNTIAKSLPIFTRLHFTLPTNPKELQIVGKLVKVENAFRTVFFGVQFVLKTFGDFQLIEEYYHKLMKTSPADQSAAKALEKDIKQLK
jgi:hypothetical protein